MKSKKELRVQKVLTRCLHLGLFIKSAFFYIPCNTDGDDAQVSLVFLAVAIQCLSIYLTPT